MRPSLYSKVAETRIGVPEEVVVRSLVWTTDIKVPSSIRPAIWQTAASKTAWRP